MPLPRWLANIGRGISEKKRTEARRWAGSRTSKQKYRLPEAHKPDATVAGSTKRLASRFHQLKAGHCRTGQYCTGPRIAPTPSAGGASAARRQESTSLRGVRSGRGSRRSSGRR